MQDVSGLTRRERAEAYRQFAEDLRRRAAAASDVVTRESCGRLAASWDALANSIDPPMGVAGSTVHERNVARPFYAD